MRKLATLIEKTPTENLAPGVVIQGDGERMCPIGVIAVACGWEPHTNWSEHPGLYLSPYDIVIERSGLTVGKVGILCEIFDWECTVDGIDAAKQSVVKKLQEWGFE